MDRQTDKVKKSTSFLKKFIAPSMIIDKINSNLKFYSKIINKKKQKDYNISVQKEVSRGPSSITKVDFSVSAHLTMIL